MTHPLILKLQTLGELPADDLRLLESLTDDVRSFTARRDIIREGQVPTHVHLMLEGWSCRYQIVEDGQRQITALLMPGDFCDAQITILQRMDHGILTLTPSKVAFIPRETMLRLTDRPAIARALWWASLVDEAVLRAWIVNLGRRDAVSRVAHLFCEVFARLAHVGLTDGNEFQLPLTQEQLADATSLTSVHVNRVLRVLREEGLATSHLGKISIKDVARLQQMSGFDPSYLHLSG